MYFLRVLKLGRDPIITVHVSRTRDSTADTKIYNNVAIIRSQLAKKLANNQNPPTLKKASKRNSINSIP